jgi:hypothetical protein
MKLKPVVQVVQINRIPGISVRQTIGRKNTLTGSIVVNVTSNGIIESSDGIGVQLDGGLPHHPFLELGIGGFGVGDEHADSFSVETKAVDDHGVITGPDTGITFGYLSGGFERNLLPKARKMKNSKWTGRSGTDERYDFGHGYILLWVVMNGMKARRRMELTRPSKNGMGESSKYWLDIFIAPIIKGKVFYQQNTQQKRIFK